MVRYFSSLSRRAFSVFDLPRQLLVGLQHLLFELVMILFQDFLGLPGVDDPAQLGRDGVDHFGLAFQGVRRARAGRRARQGDFQLSRRRLVHHDAAGAGQVGFRKPSGPVFPAIEDDPHARRPGTAKACGDDFHGARADVVQRGARGFRESADAEEAGEFIDLAFETFAGRGFRHPRAPLALFQINQEIVCAGS